MHVSQIQVQHEHHTVADLITSAVQEGYWDVISGEDIEVAEYEIVEEDRGYTSDSTYAL